MDEAVSRWSLLDRVAVVERCAVAVIDVQNDFCSVGGAFHREGRNLQAIRALLPTLAAFLDESRRLGVAILFLQHQFSPEQLTPFMRARDRLLFGGEGYPVPGSWGEQICSQVSPLEGEPALTKHWYSAFSNPEFEKELSRRGVQTLVLTGVLTNVCVETTLREADRKDYYTILVSDCVASDAPELHRATLENVEGYFGLVCSSTELLAHWSERGK